MISVRRNRRAAAGFLLAAIACALIAFLRRHHLGDSGGGIEGAYFTRSVGGPASAGVIGGTVFDPFHPLNAYLWLGGAVAFALSSAVLGLLSAVGRGRDGSAEPAY